MTRDLRQAASCQLFFSLMLMSLGVLPSMAETPEPKKPATSPHEAIEAADGPAVHLQSVSTQAIDDLRQRCLAAEAQADEAQTDESRTEALEYCDKAAGKLTEAKKLSTAIEALKAELEQARTANDKPPKPADIGPSGKAPDAAISIDQLRSRVTELGQELTIAREKADKIAGEIKRRAERRKALPELLARNREQLDKPIELPKMPVEGGGSLLAEAKQLYHLARREYLTVESQWLEQENLTYESTSRWWLARRDAAEKQLQTKSELLKTVKEQVADANRLDAEQQAKAARIAAINAHPAVKSAAAINAELADHNEQLVARMRELAERLTQAKELGQTMKNRLADVTKRASTVHQSAAIGTMLRTQQDQLPKLSGYRERLAQRPIEASQLGLDVYEWESLRRDCLLADQHVAQAKLRLATEFVDLPPGAEVQLRTILEARTGFLAELISNANDCLSRIEELDAAETEVVSTTQQLRDFIAEQILWVRSAPTIGLADLQHSQSFFEDISKRSEQANTLAATVTRDAKRRGHWWALALIVTCTLVIGRSRVRSQLLEAGISAAKPTATQYRPTVIAALATLFMALPVPLLAGFVGWRLSRDTETLAFATGWALMLFAAAYAMLSFVRHASRQGGLGTNHFGWDSKGLAAISRTTRSLQLLALPLLAVAVGVEIGNDASTVNSLGRLSLISALLVVGILCYRLCRPKGAFRQAIESTNQGSWPARWAKLLAPLAALGVASLIVASIAGYHYTAIQLTRRIFVSCLFVFACFALRSLLMRWLVVAYRRVAMQLAREKRQALLDAQENSSGEAPPVEIEPQVSLADINQQARKLVGLGVAMAFVLSMWFIWGDVLPALGIFNRVELWASSLTSANPDVGPTYITLGDLVISAAIFMFTWFAGRNLPGLLEIAVLQKLPLDAGARYAATAITRYGITVIGLALGMRQLGISWQSVQWLVAAMTVGLGFGLQEIFANFVSGIILLFERPARVGDTVTVGEITGTVTKIRIRATTILDWDSKELIVPNKDFVTGNLVNWTLSNPYLRVIVNVGIAYGSDTRLATKLLYQVAEENPNVLDNPEPVVIFNEFGDSSLNFELRLFVNDLTMYRRLRHELHLAIDDLFKQHHIEIAFPQCDLHVRSVPVPAIVGQSQNNEDPMDAAAA